MEIEQTEIKKKIESQILELVKLIRKIPPKVFMPIVTSIDFHSLLHQSRHEISIDDSDEKDNPELVQIDNDLILMKFRANIIDKEEINNNNHKLKANIKHYRFSENDINYFKNLEDGR